MLNIIITFLEYVGKSTKLFLIILLFFIEVIGLSSKMFMNILKKINYFVYTVFYSIMDFIIVLLTPLINFVEKILNRFFKVNLSALKYVINNKRIQATFGIMLIILGPTLILTDIYAAKKIDQKNKSLMQDFFNSVATIDEDLTEEEIQKEKEELMIDNSTDPTLGYEKYFAVLEIGAVSLKQGVVLSNSNVTTIDWAVSALRDSDLPNIKNGNFVLAAHSGVGKVAYFNEIHKLNEMDIITVYYKNYKYTYSVTKNFIVDETDLSVLERTKNKTIITLITCKKNDNKKRVIIVGELISTELYQ